jgi:hypothetical protein
MDDRISRFTLCDTRLHPYLDKVLDRVPKEVKEQVLNDIGLQIIAQDDFHSMCVVTHEFENPPKRLVYMNIDILKEPEYRIECAVAHALARYAVGEKEIGLQEEEAEEALINWGFERELESMRYCKAVFDSESFKVGYEWAKKQDYDYLMQHFGLYFDEWNDKGLGRMTRERFHEIYDQSEIPLILAGMPGAQRQKVPGSKEPASGKLTSDESVVSGIMEAMKDLKNLGAEA